MRLTSTRWGGSAPKIGLLGNSFMQLAKMAERIPRSSGAPLKLLGPFDEVLDELVRELGASRFQVLGEPTPDGLVALL